MTRGKNAEDKFIAHEQLLLARARRSHQAAAEELARIAAAGRQAAASLQSAAEGLRYVQQECAKAGARFEESSRFRAECEAAAQLPSVEDMIRRRDELLAQYRKRTKIRS